MKMTGSIKDALKILALLSIPTLTMAASSGPRSVETARIQGEIDRVAAQGGGRVAIAKGEHPCGTLYLRSGVELHLEEGAVLLGSEKSEDYDDAIPKAEMYDYEQMAPESRSLKAFIYAQGATNIAITGKGTIDGQGPRFFDQNTVLWKRFWAKPKVHRPRMVVLFGCKGVRFEGVTFKDCPVWTMWLRDCEDIAIDGIAIDCEQKMINSDGIDLDCCRHVRAGNCRMKTGDDGFAIRAIRSKVDRQRPAVSEDIVVTNCFIDSACQGVRIGCPSDDTIRNCLFKDIVFRGYNAIGSQQPTWYLEAGDRGYLRTKNIVFDGWDIDCQGHALEMFVSNGISLRDFGHFVFRNFTIKADNPAIVKDGDRTKIRDLVFENISGRTEGLPIRSL